MLSDGFEEMFRTIFWITLCTISVLFLYLTTMGNVIFLICIGAMIYILLFLRFIKKFQIKLKDVNYIFLLLMWLDVALLPLCYNFINLEDNKVLSLCIYILILYGAFVIYADKKMKVLQDIICTIDPELQNKEPHLFRDDISRISDRKYMLQMDAVLDNLCRTTHYSELKTGIDAWYAIYAGFILVYQFMITGIFLYCYLSHEL